MPILSGNEKAKMVARLGVMRLGASRLDYYQPSVHVTVDGVDATDKMRISGVTINDYLDGTPNTMSCRMEGIALEVGQEIKVALGEMDAAHILFAGHILELTQIYEDIEANVAYDLTCIDYTWLLDRRLVTATYTSTSATAIAQALITDNTSGFTSTHVEAGLATIDEITFTLTPVSECLNQLARRGGWYWLIDPDKDLHFGTTIDRTTAVPVTDSHKAGLRNLKWSNDLSQVKTRVTAMGRTTTALATVTGSDIPITDPTPLIGNYAGTSFVETAGGRRHAYSGVDGPDVIYQYVTPALYGAYFTLGTGRPAGTDTINGIVSSPEAAERLNALAGTFGVIWLECAGQIFSAGSVIGYAGYPSTALTFSGIPGAGEPHGISVDLPTNAIVRFCNTLRLAENLTEPINAGETIRVGLTLDASADAKAALAAAVGGDGIHEESIEDPNWSIGEMYLEAYARLNLVSDPLVSARYTTRDQTNRSGRTVSITLGAPTNLSGTLRLQQVTITQLGESADVFPLRQVEASSRRFSLEDLLRQIKGGSSVRVST